MANVAKINLVTLKQNAKIIKKRLNKGVKFCAVVKADAYGHGAIECANALYSIVDCFAVAILEEAVALRLSGIDKDILILTPLQKNEIIRAMEYNLTLSISSLKELREIYEICINTNKKVKIHIAYNTGMNRLGLDGIKDLKKAIAIIKRSKVIILDGFYSHFASPENKKTLSKALNKFLLAKNLIKSYNNKVTCHISSSGGFLAGVQEDMVRIGILLYGYKPFDSDIKVKPIMKIFSHVIKSRTLLKGESALYGYNPAESKTRISIIRYGYADGLNRKVINGQFNNRCMDLTALKLNKRSHSICIMDNADVLAKEYNTISYEILVSASCRAEKIYIR